MPKDKFKPGLKKRCQCCDEISDYTYMDWVFDQLYKEHTIDLNYFGRCFFLGDKK